MEVNETLILLREKAVRDPVLWKLFPEELRGGGKEHEF